MKNIQTDIGKIYCIYNKETDDFDKLRLVHINGENTKTYIMAELDDNYHIIPDSNHELSEEQYNEIKKNYIVLKSDGIVSITNIVSVENEIREIRDVIAIFFPNNKSTQIPDAYQPYVVARQGINDIYAEMGGETDKVGLSITLDTLPAGYALSDFMQNTRVLSSYLTQVYKTDTDIELGILLDNEESSQILQDLFDHRLNYLENIYPNFDREKTLNKEYIDGYNRTLTKFLLNSGFINDYLGQVGIMYVDFEIQNGIPLKDDDKLLLSALYEGIKINKAVPLKFGYDINLAAIKMKYVIVIDKNYELWIIPYTEYSDEVPVEVIYNLNDDKTSILHNRLMNCVLAYDRGNGLSEDESDIASNIIAKK